VVAGFSQLLGDASVLEYIYGDGFLSKSQWYPLICLLIPFLPVIYCFFSCCPTLGDEEPEFRKVRATIDKYSIPRLLFLAVSLVACGIIFDSLIICAGLPEPALGVKVVTIILVASFLVIVLVMSIGFILGTLSQSEEMENSGKSELLDDIKDRFRELCVCCSLRNTQHAEGDIELEPV
jgi:hypothetical protein